LRLLREPENPEVEAVAEGEASSADTPSVTQGDEAAMPGASDQALPPGALNGGATGVASAMLNEAPDLAEAGAGSPSPGLSADLSSDELADSAGDLTAEQAEVAPVAAPPEAGRAGPVSGAGDAKTAPLCMRVGPLAPADADAMVATLPSNLKLISDTSEEYAVVDGYFVLIPALPSVTAAQQALKDLEAAGIKDTWLFRGGELRNAISLGVYSSRAGAQRHADLVARKGFATAEVREKTSPAERRWLQLKGPEGGVPAAGLSLPKGVTATPQACP